MPDLIAEVPDKFRRIKFLENFSKKHLQKINNELLYEPHRKSGVNA